VDKPCACGADQQESFRAEIAIHHSGKKDNKSACALFVFPDVMVCLNCGNAQFKVPAPELGLLVKHRNKRSSEVEP
jgi:hypothetical protein